MIGKVIEFASVSNMFNHLSVASETVVLEGMVKEVAPDSLEFRFSPSGCDQWVNIPGDSVSHFVPLGKVPCGDHHHHSVALHLKRPESGTGAVLADLFNTQMPALRNLSFASIAAHVDNCPPPDGSCPQGYYWDAGSNTCRCRGRSQAR